MIKTEEYMFSKNKNVNEAVQHNRKKHTTYILIATSIVLIVIAFFLITSNKFWVCVQNIDYYALQYEYTNSVSSEYFSSDYRFLASEWKNLYNEALAIIICHILSAIALSVAGSIGLSKGIQSLKRLRNSSNENKLN